MGSPFVNLRSDGMISASTAGSKGSSSVAVWGVLAVVVVSWVGGFSLLVVSVVVSAFGLASSIVSSDDGGGGFNVGMIYWNENDCL